MIVVRTFLLHHHLYTLEFVISYSKTELCASMHKGSCFGEHFGKDSEVRANRHHQDYSNLSRESLQISICDWHRGWGVDQKYGEE